MNTYSFPEHVQIFDQSRSLVTRILQTEPTKRPSLDEILAHDFFHMGNSIPKLLPASTLACPPSQAYMKQFTGQTTLTKGQSSASTARLESTAPVNVKQNPNNVNMAGTLKPDTVSTERNLMHTERVKPGGDLGYARDSQNQNRNTLNPSPSVPTFNKKEEKNRPFTPRSDKEKTLDSRPTTQTQNPSSKQVKSSAHSV